MSNQTWCTDSAVYSAKWTKNIIIANSTDSLNGPYKLDRATYSLIIDPVNINDTSTDYKCELTVTSPDTNVRWILKPIKSYNILKVKNLSINDSFIDVLQFFELSSLLKMDGKYCTSTPRLAINYLFLFYREAN